MNDCSECAHFAPVLTAYRVGFNEMGTPADGVVPCEVGPRFHYQGAGGDNLVPDFNRNRVMSMVRRQQQPSQEPSMPYLLLQLRRSRTLHWCGARLVRGRGRLLFRDPKRVLSAPKVGNERLADRW
jgi:hypothetical protein